MRRALKMSELCRTGTEEELAYKISVERWGGQESVERVRKVQRYSDGVYTNDVQCVA